MRYYFVKAPVLALRFFLFLAAGQALCGVPELAAADQGAGCNAYVPARINVQIFFDPVVYEYYTPMVDIRKIADDNKKDVHSETWPVGLATGQLYLKVTTDVLKIRSGYSQKTCAQVRALHVRFGFHDNKIYVAKEFPKRSCPFRKVLEHEEKHKAVDRGIVKEYEVRIRQVLEEFAADVGVLSGAEAAKAEPLIDLKLRERLEKLSSEVQAERQLRQSQVDSPEEYDRITASCDGQTMEVVRQRLDLLEATYPGFSRNAAGNAAGDTSGQEPEVAKGKGRGRN